MADQEARFVKSMENIGIARAAIITHCDNKKSVQGKLICPVCGDGTLRYSRAFNGHVHASCTTSGCVSWME